VQRKEECKVSDMHWRLKSRTSLWERSRSSTCESALICY